MANGNRGNPVTWREVFDYLRGALTFSNVFFFTCGVLILIFIAIGIFSSRGFLGSLKDVEIARGLITFLVVFTTVAIALILALYAIVTPNMETTVLKDRFGFGKEILTSLIGIL